MSWRGKERNKTICSFWEQLTQPPWVLKIKGSGSHTRRIFRNRITFNESKRRQLTEGEGENKC